MRCSGCHNLKATSRFSPDEWRGHVRKMAEKAKINGAEEELIWRYLTAAREVPAETP
jgi:hypothetical protein